MTVRFGECENKGLRKKRKERGGEVAKAASLSWAFVFDWNCDDPTKEMDYLVLL